MTLDTLIIFAGALIALLPFLGFPASWDTVIFFVLGMFVIALGVTVRRRTKHSSTSSHSLRADDIRSE